MQKDYYKILELENTATKEEISESYRRLARLYHPDLNKEEGAINKFKLVTEAFEVLSDPRKRAEYDGRGNSIFEMPRIVRRGSDSRTRITISFMESIKGCKKDIVLKKLKPCKTCNSLGYTKIETCSYCNGSGATFVQNGAWKMRIHCDHCFGMGVMHSEQCKDCQDGFQPDGSETITISIPSGIFQDTSIFIPEKGEYGPDGRGNLYLFVHTEPHDVFKRQNNDLYVTIPVTYSKLVLGGDIEVPVIDGKVVMNLKRGTPLTSKLRLKGQGVKQHKKIAGDLFVSLDLIVPENINSEYEQKLKELEEIQGAL